MKLKGVDCDQDVDGCVGNPCPTGCIDTPASQQQVTGSAYTCKDCPAGFLLNQNKTKCEGKIHVVKVVEHTLIKYLS